MVRPREAVCKRGHEIAVVGRLGNGWCKACARKGGKVGRPVEDICRQGHDKRVTGRTGSGECRVCRKARYATDAREYRRRMGINVLLPFVDAVLPFEPLERRLVAAGYHLGNLISGTQLRRYRMFGIPVLTADAIAIERLDTHPFFIYGPAFYEAEAPKEVTA